MGISKIKNLVIAALALINVFFLIIIITDEVRGEISRSQAAANACAVLTENGIAADPADIKHNDGLRPMITRRSLAAEERLAAVFLGAMERRERGVNYQFVNETRGSAVFYSGGEFSISINEGLISSGGGTRKTVKKLLEEMGVTVTELYSSEQQETVTAVCSYKKTSVFNCTIKFRFVEDSLVAVTGRYVPGAQESEENTEISSPGTAMLSFLAWVRAGGAECTQIDRVEAGYRLRDTGAFGDGVLAPVWLITADTGRYTVDTQTGEIHLLPPVSE